MRKLQAGPFHENDIKAIEWVYRQLKNVPGQRKDLSLKHYLKMCVLAKTQEWIDVLEKWDERKGELTDGSTAAVSGGGVVSEAHQDQGVSGPATNSSAQN